MKSPTLTTLPTSGLLLYYHEDQEVHGAGLLESLGSARCLGIDRADGVSQEAGLQGLA